MSKNIHATQDWVKENLNVASINDLTQRDSRNLFDKSKVVLNMIMTDTGLLEEKSSHYISDFIPVELNSHYVMNGVRFYAWYDADYQFIYRWMPNDTDTEFTTFKTYKRSDGSIPKYVRISGYTQYMESTQFENGQEPTSYQDYDRTTFGDFALLNNTQINQIEQELEDTINEVANNNVLYGKKWCVVGDSFSDGYHILKNEDPKYNFDAPTDWYFSNGKFAGESKIYGYLIGDRNNMEIQDMGVSGRTLAIPSDGYNIKPFSLPEVYQSIDADVDYITIMIGGNDEKKATITLGNIDSTDTFTFYGAWNVVLKYIIENYPKARLGIIIPNGFSNPDVAKDYVTATIEIAKKYGVPYINLNGDERTRAMFRTINDKVSADIKTILRNHQAVIPQDEKEEDGTIIRYKNLHPNLLAHTLKADIIENFLRSL